MKVSEKVAEILLDIKAVNLNAQKPYHWVSGIIAPIYTDCRLVMGYPEDRSYVADQMVKVIQEQIGEDNIDIIAGVSTSGIPHAAWVADRLNMPMIYVRGSKKDHGKENLIEGVLEKGQRAVLIEDLVSTGGSSIKSIEAIREQGGICDYQISLFTYGLPKAKENFSNAGVTTFPLTNFAALVDAAVKNGYLEGGDKELVLEWSKSPETWGK